MKLLIGGGTYTARWLTEAESQVGRCVGFCRQEGGDIAVSRHVSPADQAMILWHEITHAIFHTNNISNENLNEEDVCRFLEGPWMQVMRDNPALVDALLKASRNGKELPL